MNHSAGAQKLLMQTAIKLKFGLVVCEPCKYITHVEWCFDQAGIVALFRKGNIHSPPLRLLVAGRGYALSEWGEINIVLIRWGGARST